MKQILESTLDALSAAIYPRRKLPTVAEIDALENNLKVTLPESYRCFLQYFSNRTVTALTPCPTNDGLYIERFHGFELEHDAETYDYVEFDEAYTAPDAISIASDAFGGQFLMFLNANANERIYFYDTEGEGGDFQEDNSWLENGMSFEDLPKFDDVDEKPQAFVNFTFIAPTFMDLMALLKRMPD